MSAVQPPGMRPGTAMGADPNQKRGLRNAMSALEHPQYRWLFFSNMAFFLAMQGQGLVRSWIAYDLTQSELALGMVAFTVAVPMLLIAPIGGVMSDRFERRNLIAGGQAIVVVSELTILALLMFDALQFWHLLTAAALMGCVFPFIMPARQALVVNVVGKRGLPNAMALSMAGMNLTRVAGPALAGFLLGPLGVKGTYMIGVSLYMIALGGMMFVHRHPPGERKNVSIYQNVVEGAVYVRDHRLVLVLIFFGLIPMFLAMPFQTLMVVFAEQVWDVGSQGLGLLSACAGVGGVVGSFYVAWRADSQNRVVRMMASIVGFGFFLFLFSMTPWFASALALVFIANAFASVFSTLNNTAIQMLIPDEVRGRISSFLMMSFSLPLLGTLPMSAVAEGFGAPVAVAVASGLAIVVAGAFYLLSPALRNMDTTVRKALEEDDAAEAAADPA